MGTLLSALFAFLRAALRSRATLALENAALRQQPTIYQRNQKHPRIRSRDRVFWVLLRRLWSGWERALLMVKPETVVSWHRQGFRLFWRRRSKSGKVGRPRIPRTHIAFIRRISSDHPAWGEDRIAEEFDAKFGFHHSASTIRRYMMPRHGLPRGKQTWRTFIQNHAKEVWAYDFLLQHTASFAVVYAFVIIEIASRRIVHANVTTSPTMACVKQQIREATTSGQTPRFLVRDNDGIFGQFGRRITVEGNGRKRSYRCHLDRWLGEVIGIEGLPIPYGAPNASPHAERFMRTLRHEALDHFIFLSPDHIRRVVSEFVDFDWSYNPKLPRARLCDLTTGQFIARHLGVLLIGPPGVGKSHACTAIAVGAIRAGYRVLVRSSFDLVQDFAEAEATGERRDLVEQLTRVDLLALEDFGMRKLGPNAAEDLLEIFVRRHEKASTLITTNRPTEDWGQFLGDVPATTAILDRFLEHAEIITMHGKSYRLRGRVKGRGPVEKEETADA